MAWWWSDGFDLYALPADALLGYWDSGTTTAFTLGAGRFTGSRALVSTASGATWLIKSSNQNDNIHHIFCAFQQTNVAIGGTTLGNYFQLSDGATNQCCIVFRSDGGILLTSATPGGTVLATYAGAVTAINTWYTFEFEVVIHNTAGSFAVRKNGNTSNDFSATGLNTRPGANTYANKITIANSAGLNFHWLDDLLWRSDTASVPWVGDIRCYTRRPDTDTAAAWTRPATFQMQPYAGTTTASTQAVNSPRYTPFISQGGTIGSVIVNLLVGYTGNLKCAIFASTAGQPGTVIQSATAVVNNPVIGANTFTFSPPVSVAKGTQFFVGTCSDAAISSGLAVANVAPYATAGFSGGATYATFPVNNPTVSVVGALPFFPVVTPTYNADAVSEPCEDAAASYVYSSTVGQADLYTLTGIDSTPTVIIGVTTRALAQKSDAGTRIITADLRSGATTVSSSPGVLNSGVWSWVYRTDLTDPATGSAWTATGVNNARVGVTVTA